MVDELVCSRATPTLRAIFDRVDRDGSLDIDEREVAVYLRRLGIGTGWFGGSQVDQAVDMFMDKFRAGPERRVSWQKFVEGGKHLLPPSVLNDRGQLDCARAERLFREIAGGGRRVTMDELAAYLEREIGEKAQSTMVSMFAGTIADAAAKVAVDALDADRDKAFTRDDLIALIDDINDQLSQKRQG